MIRHIVMWKFKEAEGRTGTEHAAWVKEQLLALPALIPQIREIEVQLDTSGSANNYDAVLITVFDNFEALGIYKTHPEHKKISSYVARMAEKRASVDYTLD